MREDILQGNERLYSAAFAAPLRSLRENVVAVVHEYIHQSNERLYSAAIAAPLRPPRENACGALAPGLIFKRNEIKKRKSLK